MLKGIDISHHNEALILKDPGLLFKQDFVIMKATEGSAYIDKYMNVYCGMLGLYYPIGLYHYARPEKGNSPETEAAHFLCAIAPYIHRAVLALDVEADALVYPDIDVWVYRWLEYVHTVTGVRPLVYCSESQCYRFKLAAKNNYGLWVAKWSDNKPVKTEIKPWKFYAIWQYAVDGVDRDYFNGTLEAWNAYALGGD